MTKLTKVSMIVFLFTGLAACGPDGGTSTEDGGQGGAGGAAVDAAPIPADVAQFLGTWTYTSGSYNVTCGSDPAIAEPASGTVTFSLDTANQLTASDGQGCDVPCTVSGDTAVGLADTACPAEGTVTTSLVYTLSNGALREQGSGQGVSNGVTCSVTDDALLSRS